MLEYANKDISYSNTITILGPTQPPIQWIPGALSLGVKRPGREAYHSPPSSAGGQRMSGAIPPFPNTPSWRGAQLRHRDNFTLPLPISVATLPGVLMISHRPHPGITPHSRTLTEHYAMKAYWGSGGIAPRILDLGTRWR
jgi:hypothetical protein